MTACGDSKGPHINAQVARGFAGHESENGTGSDGFDFHVVAKVCGQEKVTQARRHVAPAGAGVGGVGPARTWT
jgi:hypothetical protein